MKPKKLTFTETFIRYGSYPLILGATAIVLFGGLAAGWPYFPTVPLIVAAALASVALLERQLPFHAAWQQDHRDSVCDADGRSRWHREISNMRVLAAPNSILTVTRQPQRYSNQTC